MRLLGRDFSSSSLTNGSSDIPVPIFDVLLPLLGWPDLCSGLLCSYMCIVFTVFTYPDDRSSSFSEVSIDVFRTVWFCVSEGS